MSGSEPVTRRAIVAAVDRLDVGLPGGGRTAERWLALVDLAAGDVALARMCEAHLDAVAILAEAGLTPRPGAVYGVWASAAPGGAEVILDRGRLTGTKSFCSGIGIVDRALIDVQAGEGRQLVDADVRLVGHGGRWQSPESSAAGSSSSSAVVEWHHAGLAACNTGRVTLADVTDVEPVGAVGWYLDRPGFWHGACGPAACWAGGAAGLLAYVEPGEDPFRLAAAGAMAAAAWTMQAVLQRAGDEIDRDPGDVGAARRRARMVRHTVHEQATAMLDRFQRAWGPRPLVEVPGVAARIADVGIYLRQHHGDRDLAALAHDVWPDRSPAR